MRSPALAAEPLEEVEVKWQSPLQIQKQLGWSCHSGECFQLSQDPLLSKSRTLATECLSLTSPSQ